MENAIFKLADTCFEIYLISKQTIRKEIRQKRNRLTVNERRAAGVAVLNQLKKNSLYYSVHRIAAYIASDGEIPLTSVINFFWHKNKKCFLPVLFGYGGLRMHFAEYCASTNFSKNKFGIPEPDLPMRKQLQPNLLDIVLMPLVAFDESGNRLGMGGGYYDRSFAFLRHRKAWKKPKLVGVAYDFQQVDALPAEEWDVPLDYIVTPTRLIKFQRCS